MTPHTRLHLVKSDKEPLAPYRSMRNFGVTAEPRGSENGRSARTGRAMPFVVQKHAATRLHYDFRLGWNGVLKSWAITKGPSLFPGDKRLAVQVEDHPLDYGDFEGTIPKGQYGGGTVMVWDKGEWRPHGDVEQGMRDGHLKFGLKGKKLHGDWALIRMNGRAAGRPDKANWLLIKEKDQYSQGSPSGSIIEEMPNSAKSGRTMEQIAAHERNGHRSASGTASKTKLQTSAAKVQRIDFAQEKKNSLAEKRMIHRLPVEGFPKFIPPQLAQITTTSPGGKDWLHELKLDGYRIQIHVRTDSKQEERTVRLFTRKGLDWAHRMPDIAGAARKLRVKAAVLDGEAVALDDRGISNFADLQSAFQEGGKKSVSYFAFDLLHLNGHNLRNIPLTERRTILESLLSDAAKDAPVQLSVTLQGDGNQIFKKACELGAEGIVSKLGTATYESGRSSAWLKRKCSLEEELVIGGFTLPSNGTAGVGALLLGYYENDKLRYAGRTGTGFTQALHRQLRAKLNSLARASSPFAEVPQEARKGAHWVKPELVAQISFSNWTRDRIVRQASFKGLREDKPAEEVVLEQPISKHEIEEREIENARSRAQRSERASAAKPSRISGGNRNGLPGGMRLEITHPDKVLDTESGLTKQALAEYYLAVADHMLPHIAGRPLSIVRCPDGNSKPCFFQKHAGSGLSKAVHTVSIPNRKSGEKEGFLTVDSAEGLVALAQMGVLEIHRWGSRNDSIETPDRIFFDLDPDVGISWKALAQTALSLQATFSRMGLKSYVQSTGGKGLHVMVPIEPALEWPKVKAFARRIAVEMERERPDLYVTTMTKAKRKDRIYLDYQRNDREATTIAPYSPRARNGTPVAMPLRWSELSAATAPLFHISDFSKWKARLRRDPWLEVNEIQQKLPAKAIPDG